MLPLADATRQDESEGASVQTSHTSFRQKGAPAHEGRGRKDESGHRAKRRRPPIERTI